MCNWFEETLDELVAGVSNLESIAQELEEHGSPNLARGVQTLAHFIGECVEAVEGDTIAKIDRQLAAYGVSSPSSDRDAKRVML